ncbi:hypothetical protein ACFPH6_19545 [Streptomyces xiangluensis]|uniref:Uncharacterized protein n=1 Tax=Streptomyces xiangluensis TaxID=2665720 RepID=A0ABV8YQG8_9ACTN
MTKQQTTTKSKPTGLAPCGPRGLGGYCWAEHPETSVHCCVKATQPHTMHWHPYTGTRWT